MIRQVLAVVLALAAVIGVSAQAPAAPPSPVKVLPAELDMERKLRETEFQLEQTRAELIKFRALAVAYDAAINSIISQQFDGRAKELNAAMADLDRRSVIALGGDPEKDTFNRETKTLVKGGKK